MLEMILTKRNFKVNVLVESKILHSASKGKWNYVLERLQEWINFSIKKSKSHFLILMRRCTLEKKFNMILNEN